MALSLGMAIGRSHHRICSCTQFLASTIPVDAPLIDVMNATPPVKVPMTRSKAVNCMIVNLLATPGLGSLLGGRKMAGVIQLCFSVTGFSLVVVWFGYLFTNVYRQMKGIDPLPPHPWLGWSGLLLFAISWFLSLATSLSLLREAREP
jgi:hypothetical protein